MFYTFVWAMFQRFKKCYIWFETTCYRHPLVLIMKLIAKEKI